MKQFTTTLIFAILVIGNCINANAKTYRATQNNSQGQVSTIIISDGDNDRVLEPTKQYRFTYNSIGQVSEKAIYKWNAIKNCWENDRIYRYTYDSDKQLSKLLFANSSTDKSNWEDFEYTIYPKVNNDVLQTINYVYTVK